MNIGQSGPEKQSYLDASKVKAESGLETINYIYEGIRQTVEYLAKK